MDYVTLMTWVDSNGKRWMRVFDSDSSATNYEPALEYQRTFLNLKVNGDEKDANGISFDFLPDTRIIY